MKSNKDIIEQLPGDLRRIAEVLDVESALKIEKIFSGTWIYIGKLDDLRREVRNKEIRGKYSDGMRVQKIAVQYKLTERQIWNILGVEPEEATPLPLLDLLK